MKYIALAAVVLLFAVNEVSFSADNKSYYAHSENSGTQNSVNKTDKFTELPKNRVAAKKDTTEFGIDFPDVLLEHIHNKFVHFPIVLSLLAFVLGIVNKRNGKFGDLLSPLLLAALISSILAMQAGFKESGEFSGTAKEWVLQIHQAFGIALTIMLLLWYFLYSKPDYRKFHLLAGGIVAILILLTGFFGGVLSHY